MSLISGKKIAEQIQNEIREKLQKYSQQAGLAMILVGSHAPSHTYVNVKKKACQEVGIISKVVQLPENVTQQELAQTIDGLNGDSEIDGILLQSPLPPHLNANLAFSHINPEKDVDGFHPLNMGKLLLGQKDGFIPCTPLGVMELLKRSNIDVRGKNAVVVGRSNIVGKPMSQLLLQADATVTICHSKTKNIKALTQQAEILIAAIGKAAFITKEMVREGAVVIDVGINRAESGLVGDVAPDVASKCSAITPVPGGVGPMTVAMLLQNTTTAFEKKCARSS